MYINNPKEIEVNSMKIIDEALEQMKNLNNEELQVARRIIHTTGDVKYEKVIEMSGDFVDSAIDAIKDKKKLYVDTRMTEAGINKRALKKLGLEIVCYIDDPQIAEIAKKNKTTRSYAAIKKAIDEGVTCFSVGNAPTALFALMEEIDSENVEPDYVIGVPVGFVGAAESKEELLDYDVPQITIQGNKGGSNVAASIVNALMYLLVERDDQNMVK